MPAPATRSWSPHLAALRASGARVRQLFLEASTDVLVRRYESSRRRHPLLAPGEGLAEAIEHERALLEPVRAEADVVVDTSNLNVHELHDRIVGLFGEADLDAGMQTRVVSFGYKHGLPVDVDVVLDCRFLPNPHWVEELRPQTGLDDAGARLRARPAGRRRVPRSTSSALLDLLLPAYVAEGKAYLTIAFGCTGGRHRSVVIAEEVAELLRAREPARRSCCTATSRSRRRPVAGLERDRPICSDEPTIGAPPLQEEHASTMSIRVGINGFGRIGRNFFRAAKQRGADIDFVAANDLGSKELMAHLLKYDSILGTWDAEVARHRRRHRGRRRRDPDPRRARSRRRCRGPTSASTW